MHPLWQIPELLIQIVSFLPASSIAGCFYVSHHFRTTLKTNLPPQLRPLPDCVPFKRHSDAQSLPQRVRDAAQAYITQEASTPKQLKVEDTYYHWSMGARQQILDDIRPHLHPVLAKYATSLVDGYEALAEGKMGVCLQTEIRYHDLHSLVQGEERPDCADLLAVLPPKSVTVFCLGGVSWDLLYANVKYRTYGSVKRFSVQVEREAGVRLNDVMDELKGTLIVDGRGGGLGQDVVLVWEFEDSWCE